MQAHPHSIMPFYAVKRGRVPGIYETWKETTSNVYGVKYPIFRRFECIEDAEAFMQQEEETETPTVLEDERTLVCFTDGACVNNGKRTARASYAVVWPEHEELNMAKLQDDGCGHTNNRAEMTAVINAIEQANKLDPSFTKQLIVFSDSTLIVNTISDWMWKWKERGWKKTDGNLASNLDLVMKVDELMKNRKVIMRHVKAHTKKKDWASNNNRLVDQMARDVLAKC